MKNRPNKEQRQIVFITFETPYARSGGLAAVMGILPTTMARYEKNSCIIAPYFKNITDLNKLQKDGKIKEFSSLSPVDVVGKKFTVEVIEVTGLDDFKTYLLASTGFFTAPTDPYINPINPDKPMHPSGNPNRPGKLVEDVLLFSAAVPEVLINLNKTENLVLQLQDWETACVAQAINNDARIQSAACVLTLHNPYDNYLDPAKSSPLVAELVSFLKLKYDNILVQMIPLMDGPLTTVSQNFADELTVCPLQSQVFAPHLQHLIERKGMIGIDNGIFGTARFPFSARARQQADQGNFKPLQQEKWRRRKKLGAVLEAYQQELAQRARETWGEDLNLSEPQIPVFLILGRDDPRQKGFDVVAAAIEMIPPGRARYIFTPIPGDEGFIGLEFLKKLAKKRPGEVKVFPFRMDRAPFTALQEGSSFMAMCSLYEPFGAATEAYLAGMPVVARATGGLVQQVTPCTSSGLGRYGRQLVALFHNRHDNPTGFLFREPASVNDADGWQKIIDCAYWNRLPRGDRVEDRKGIPLFDAMTQQAAWAFLDAIDLYNSDQLGYAKMIYHGFNLLDKFSWDRAVQDYRRLYDRVCR